jgi:hypothetical protein
MNLLPLPKYYYISINGSEPLTIVPNSLTITKNNKISFEFYLDQNQIKLIFFKNAKLIKKKCFVIIQNLEENNEPEFTKIFNNMLLFKEEFIFDKTCWKARYSLKKTLFSNFLKK